MPGQVIAETDPLSHTATTVYDAAGRGVVEIDEESRRTTNTYDKVDRPLTKTNPLSQVTTYAYDLAVGARGRVHRGDPVVLVPVVPRLDGPPGEPVWLTFFIQKRHRRDVVDPLVTRFPGSDIDRSEDLHFDVDRWSLHGRHLGRVGWG